VADLALQCADILAGDPLAFVAAEIQRLGYGGNVRLPKLIYVSATTRLLPKRKGTLPCHFQVNGPAGTGKTYLVDSVLDLFPNPFVLRYDSTSPKVMVHDPAPLKHLIVYYTEADSIPGAGRAGEEDNPAAAMLRTLLQSGQATTSIP
jgi:hypothetical protein